MTQVEAAEVVKSYGFERGTVQDRPAAGWVENDGTPNNVQGRARAVEQRLHQQVAIAEVCPVGHGLLGFGILYMFYGTDGRLLEHYRYQIN
jgi:hypothetical protein